MRVHRYMSSYTCHTIYRLAATVTVGDDSAKFPVHLFLQAHSHKWNTKEELGKDKHETPTRQRLLVVVGTEIFTIATPARGVVIFIRVNLATRPTTITTDVSVDLAKHGALAS